MLKDHIMSRWWSTCLLLLVLLLSFVLNFLVRANFLHAYSLQSQQSMCHDHEKLALLHFKHSFLIDCSASYYAFARPKVKSWRESSSDDKVTNGVGDCCRWDGVECNKETGHVVGLDLSSSCLYGTFPHNSFLFSLDHLQELDLSDNNFNFSRIPSAIDHLSKLTILTLSQSNFSGPIPLEISKLSSLSVLDLSNNNLRFQYDMGFKMLIGNLTQLTVLSLDSVDISNVVPIKLSNLTFLKILSLSNCSLSGVFPADVLRLPKLELVSLNSNSNLQGYLPDFPPDRPLRSLYIEYTAFSGKLTPSIGNLVSLTELSLTGTSFTGSIPSSLGNLTKLTLLKLKWCNFQGDLPLFITNLTQLNFLTLSDVNVSLPVVNSWLLKLSKLEVLALSNMSITGEFPLVIANLTRLTKLDLGYNHLTSRLPDQLANLKNLVFLDLRGNYHIQDPLIPQWFSQLINLKSLFLTSNGSAVARFDPILNLHKLETLSIKWINLIFPPDASTKSSLPNLHILQLKSCNLTSFPHFLSYHHELEFIDLSENNIVGKIPQWFVNMTSKSLVDLTLDNNSITGFELPQVSLPWNSLEAFFIQHNQLQGQLPIPPSSLKIYQVSQNQLSGIIPKQICKTSSLLYLDLSGNNFRGSIPPCIGPELAASLQVLNLRGNRLQGTIPHTFTRACKLKMINLSENQLEGRLPKSLTHCEELEVLDVGKNCFSDTFPSWLGSLLMLKVFVSRHNEFHGRISTVESDHQFSCLQIIDLSYNFYYGDLPAIYFQNWLAMTVVDEDHLDYSSSPQIDVTISASDFDNQIILSYPYEITITNKGSERLYSKILSVFRVIDLSSNNFTGVIPSVLGNLRGLQALNLSNNNLVGDIPSSLANIIDLESLDLSQNMLSGRIPQQLTKLNFLEIFNVSHNRLMGLIPQGEQFNTFDSSCFDGNLALCGTPLSKKCHDTHPLLPSVDEKEEDSMLIDWIVRSLGCLSGCIVGFIIGKLYITDRYHDWFMETFGRRTKPKLKARRSA